MVYRKRGKLRTLITSITLPGLRGGGHWTLSTNHLTPNNPAPQIWCTWEGVYRIHDAVLIQDYPLPTGANGKAHTGIPTYPVTLPW
jgi:hypothetical protein